VARRHSRSLTFRTSYIFISRVVIENIANVLEHRSTRQSIHKKSFFNLRRKKHAEDQICGSFYTHWTNKMSTLRTLAIFLCRWRVKEENFMGKIYAVHHGNPTHEHFLKKISFIFNMSSAYLLLWQICKEKQTYEPKMNKLKVNVKHYKKVLHWPRNAFEADRE